MVKTGGEGGKGQTVRSGGGKGPAFEGGQTPWARRLPHKRGYSQKAPRHRALRHASTRSSTSARSPIGIRRVEVTPQTLQGSAARQQDLDGVKILGGVKAGKTLPAGLDLPRRRLLGERARGAGRRRRHTSEPDASGS